MCSLSGALLHFFPVMFFFYRQLFLVSRLIDGEGGTSYRSQSQTYVQQTQHNPGLQLKAILGFSRHSICLNRNFCSEAHKRFLLQREGYSCYEVNSLCKRYRNH